MKDLLFGGSLPKSDEGAVDGADEGIEFVELAKADHDFFGLGLSNSPPPEVVLSSFDFGSASKMDFRCVVGVEGSGLVSTGLFLPAGTYSEVELFLLLSFGPSSSLSEGQPKEVKKRTNSTLPEPPTKSSGSSVIC